MPVSHNFLPLLMEALPKRASMCTSFSKPTSMAIRFTDRCTVSWGPTLYSCICPNNDAVNTRFSFGSTKGSGGGGARAGSSSLLGGNQIALSGSDALLPKDAFISLLLIGIAGGRGLEIHGVADAFVDALGIVGMVAVMTSFEDVDAGRFGSS
jgi:hypothetical protein